MTIEELKEQIARHTTEMFKREMAELAQYDMDWTDAEFDEIRTRRRKAYDDWAADMVQKAIRFAQEPRAPSLDLQ